MSGDPVLRLQDVTKRRADGSVAVDVFNLSIYPGELVCLLGGRRAGQSVVLQLIAGLVQPTAGSVYVDGLPITDTAALMATVAYLSPDLKHALRLTPTENLYCYTALSGVARSRTECLQELRQIGIPERALTSPTSALPAEYRLAIWRAAVAVRSPRVILLDEPTVGLDPIAIQRLDTWVRRQRDQHAAILLATSNPSEAQHADRVAILVDGRKVTEKRRTELTPEILMQMYLQSVGGS